MKVIALTRGLDTLIDDEDYELLSGFSWFAHRRRSLFYAARNCRLPNGRRITLSMHHLIQPCLKGQEVDHVNGDTLDNRRCNLRVTDRGGNNRNQGRRKDNTSGYKGITALPSGNWLARIQISGKRLNLGVFSSKEAAYETYQQAAREHFGEFMRKEGV